jgi:hypothetical protein
MSEEIDLGGIKVPAEDWEATPESIKLVLTKLLQRIETLEEKTRKNSRNSSLPNISYMSFRVSIVERRPEQHCHWE